MSLIKLYYIEDEFGNTYATKLSSLQEAEKRQCEIYGELKACGYEPEDMPDLNIGFVIAKGDENGPTLGVE